MFSKAKTNRLPASSSNKRNHNGATFKCDATAEEILKSGNDCLNPAHNCRGSVSGTAFTEYESMPAGSWREPAVMAKKKAMATAIKGCKLSLTNNVVRGFSNAADYARTKMTSIGNSVGSLKKKVGTFGTSKRFGLGGKSRRKRRKSRRKSRKKRRKSKKRKSRRRRKKSRRRRRR